MVVTTGTDTLEELAVLCDAMNAAAVESILNRVKIPVQLGGGIRDMKTVEGWLRKGVSRVIIGTAAVRDPDTDVVVVGVPNHLHVEAVAAAVGAGKAVLCTKPLGRNADEALPAARDDTQYWKDTKTLVRTLVEMHGGTVTAASEGEGKGSEFVVRIPLATAEALDRLGVGAG